MPAISDEHHHSELRQQGLASKTGPKPTVPHWTSLFLLFGITVALTLLGTFATVSAHPPGNYPTDSHISSSSQPLSTISNTPSSNSISSSSSSSSGGGGGGGGVSTSGTVTFNNVDETRLQEILTNLYTHMKKYEQNLPASSSLSSSSSLLHSFSALPTVSLPSIDLSAPNQEHLITERVKEFFNNIEQQQQQQQHQQQQQPHQANKQENLKVNFAANGKTMGTEENNLNINIKSLPNNVQVNEHQQQQQQLQLQQQQLPQQVTAAAAGASAGSHYQMPALMETVSAGVGGTTVPLTSSQKMVKLDAYSGLTEKRSSANEVDPLEASDVPVVVNSGVQQQQQQQQTIINNGNNNNNNKYSSLGTSKLQRPKLVSLSGGEVTSKAGTSSSLPSSPSSPGVATLNSVGVVVGVPPLSVSSMSPVLSSSVQQQQQHQQQQQQQQHQQPQLSALDSSSLYDLLASIDSRVQKLQDSLVYYRNTPKPSPVHSAASQLNPIFTNYLSLIKAQVLNIESTIEAKFSNMEHKYSNMEIEDGIWKKTINWKLEEMASKLSQNENKLSFSNDQIMNKMDLFERNFQIVTNDFFSKFLLVNEKLNKIELSLQTKWNDLEVKLRNNFAAADNFHRQSQKMSSFFKPADLAESAAQSVEQSFKEQNALPSAEQQINKASATSTITAAPVASAPTQPAQSPPPPPPPPPPPSSSSSSFSPVVLSNEQAFVVKKPTEPAKESSIPGIGSKMSWNKPLLIKPPGNGTLTERWKQAQRFMKLYNSKSNQTFYNRKPFNSTFVLENAQATGQQMPSFNALMSDAPAVTVLAEAGVPEMSGSPTSAAAGQRFPGLDSLGNGNGNGNGSSKPEKTILPPQQQLQPAHSSSLGTMGNQNYRLTQTQPAAVPTTVNGGGGGGVAAIPLSQHLLNTSSPQAVANNRNIDSIDGITFNELIHQSREALLEKRELNEEILGDSSIKEAAAPPLPADRPNPVEQTINQINEIKIDKLEELDSKLQFFSTKIINIVQEMWLSSQASENYLKESLAVANKTKIMMKEEFIKLQTAVKPIQQLTTLAEEIREPIINRLTELTTALNNSMEVILNTQAGFINSCRYIRDEDVHLFEVLDYFINETAVQRNHQEAQFAQFNRSFEFLLVKLDAVNRKTVEGVRSETMKALEHIKSELHHQVSSSMAASGANQRAHGSLLASAGAQEQQHSSRASSADLSPSECFITRKEFATFCEDDKMFSTVMGAAAANNGQHTALHPLDKDIGSGPQELEIQYGNGTRGAPGIEINNGNEN